MEAFLDHIAFVCFSGAIIGLILGISCYIFERLDERLNGKISTAICNFFGVDPEKDFEDEE